VGDANLGGISTTITALDVLAMRGYDVVAVVVPDGGGVRLGNSEAIAKYARTHGVPTFVLPRIPERDIMLDFASDGVGLYKVTPSIQSTHSLKAPGFNPWTYQMISWFQILLSNSICTTTTGTTFASGSKTARARSTRCWGTWWGSAC
jgi:hypothetical protein